MDRDQEVTWRDRLGGAIVVVLLLVSVWWAARVVTFLALALGFWGWLVVVVCAAWWGARVVPELLRDDGR